MSAYLLLPEGIEEILPSDASALDQLARETVDLFYTWGYELVIPPVIDHLSSLLVGHGQNLELETFRMIDPVSGQLIGFRADMTPQVARIVANCLIKKNKIVNPTRFCYLGPILRAYPKHSGGNRCPIQFGAELYGYSGVASDIEIIRLLLATFEHVGISDICLDLGHLALFHHLMREAMLSFEQQHQIVEIMSRKSRDDLRYQLKELKLSASLSEKILFLLELFGDVKVIDQAKRYFSGISENIDFALATLGHLVEVFSEKCVVTIDLAELRGYQYHTGLIYTAYTLGGSDGIAFGGRYDNLVENFGYSHPATGFSADLQTLFDLKTKKVAEPLRIFAPLADDVALHARIADLRQEGHVVIQQLPKQSATAVQMKCTQELYLSEDKWQLKDTLISTAADNRL